jgi:hypothetical protein
LKPSKLLLRLDRLRHLRLGFRKKKLTHGPKLPEKLLTKVWLRVRTLESVLRTPAKQVDLMRLEPDNLLMMEV